MKQISVVWTDRRIYLLREAVHITRYKGQYFTWEAVSCLRRIVPGLSPPRSGFDPRSVRLRFMVHRVAL